MALCLANCGKTDSEPSSELARCSDNYLALHGKMSSLRMDILNLHSLRLKDNYSGNHYGAGEYEGGEYGAVNQAYNDYSHDAHDSFATKLSALRLSLEVYERDFGHEKVCSSAHGAKLVFEEEAKGFKDVVQMAGY